VNTVQDISAKVEILKDDEKTVSYITNNAEELAKECLNKNMKPGQIRMGNMTRIDGFNIRIETKEGKIKMVRISKAMDQTLTGDQFCAQAFSSHQQHTVNKFIYKLRQTFTPSAMVSTPSEDLKKMLEDFNRGPIIGKRKHVKEEEEFMEYDVSRAYTKCLTQITHIPKFTYFDHLTPMESIENH
jgi:hypothetical protein